CPPAPLVGLPCVHGSHFPRSDRDSGHGVVPGEDDSGWGCDPPLSSFPEPSLSDRTVAALAGRDAVRERPADARDTFRPRWWNSPWWSAGFQPVPRRVSRGTAVTVSAAGHDGGPVENRRSLAPETKKARHIGGPVV